MLVGATGCHTPDDDSVDIASAAPLLPAPCRAPETPTTLATGTITGAAIVSGRVLFIDRSLNRIDFAGGEPESLAAVDSPYGLTVTGDTAYFTGTHHVGEPNAQGKQASASALYSASASGPGDASLVVDGFSALHSAADAESVYLASLGLGNIVSFTPSSAMPRSYSLPNIAILALYVHGSDIYVAGQDFATPEGKRGILARVSTISGAVTRVLGLDGLPSDIAVDDSAIYWVEGSPYGTFETNHIARAKLDGTEPTTLAVTNATSIALDRDYVYFVSDSLGRVPKSGGTVKILATSLEGPGSLSISGSDAIWVNLSVKALSDPRPSMLLAMCLHPAD